MRRALAIVLALAGAAPALTAPALAAPWPVTDYNPKPLPGDVVLPMPCEGAMVFRRIDIPQDNALDDRKVTLGGNDARFDWAEAARADYLGAGFVDAQKAGQHYFFLGKYEVTVRQAGALGPACPPGDGEGRLPKTSITWAESNTLAAAYTKWLIANAADKLPKIDGTPGFVRLPTEAEWEFAARGGMAVSAAVFQEPVFPMPDGMAKYIWYQGTESANNELNAVGLLQPNPLGLFDMLGNAGEFVLDPYRVNKLSRLQGQAGGYTVKGGDYMTAPGDIRSAAREEFAPVDKQGERRLKTVGLRFAIVPPILASKKRLDEIQSAWKDLPKSQIGAQQDDPVKEVEVLAKAVDDPALKTRIQGLATVIKANVQTRNEQRDRAARSALRVSAYLAQKLHDDAAVIALKEKQVAALSAANETLRQTIQKGVEADRRALDDNYAFYLDGLTQLAGEYPAGILPAQATLLKREFEARQLDGLVPYLDVVTGQLARLAKDGRLDRARAMAEIAAGK